MIVTTTQSIEDFYKELAEDRPEEPPQQLYGRCGTLIEMDRKQIKISEWNSETEEYSEPLITENHVLDDIKIEKPRSEPERRARAAALLGVDQSLFSRKIEVEKPEGVLPIKRETPKATVRFLDDSDRIYIVADNVNLEVKAKMEHFASELLSYI